MSLSGYVHLEDCSVMAETEKAFLIEYEDSEYWIPKSQISDGGSNLAVGDRHVTVSVTEWWANKNHVEGSE